MEHQQEHPHAFIKDGRVTSVAVFTEHNQELIEHIKVEHNLDSIVCCCDYGSIPALYAVWDGTFFEVPTLEYLVSIGVAIDPEVPTE